MTDLVQPIRHDWTLAEIKALFAKSFNDLLFQTQTTHRRYFDPNPSENSDLDLFEKLGISANGKLEQGESETVAA